ncbi:MAG: MYXO-CTERM domain-containing protein, partial [Bradymonadia bacterium]
SLEAARRYQAGRVAGRRQFAILITDGYQCCGLISENGNLSCEREEPNLIPNQVQAMTDAGIRTYVVGFGGSTDARTLHRAAIAAGTLRPGCNPNTDNPNADEVCYLQASRGADLGEFLDQVVREINVEVCDGQDNDCDGRVDEDLARACNGACGAGEEVCFNGGWGECNAQNALPEACNNEDDDCDGAIDENISRDCATVCGQGVEVCRNGNYQGCNAPDPQPEICDGQDNNCDGVIDEGCDCSAGEERACGDNRGRCRPGTQRCLANGTWSDCDGAVGPGAEVCDGEDNDCDGVIDGMQRNCQTACGAGNEMCVEGQWEGCDAPDVVAEDCNNLDDDCDGRIDENVSRECETECGNGIQQCRGAQWTDCSARSPIEEICDNGRDDDCDGAVDDGCECTDGDTQPCGTNRGECTEGAQTCANNQWGDCVGGTDPSSETCDGLDNDCDGAADNGELCPTGLICGCGACAEPCTMNECPGESMCIFGHCIEDNCPDGTMCEEGTCVEGGGEGGAGGNGDGVDLGVPADMGSIAGSGASDDCACDVGKRSGDAPWTLLAFAGLIAIRRRRR